MLSSFSDQFMIVSITSRQRCQVPGVGTVVGCRNTFYNRSKIHKILLMSKLTRLYKAPSYLLAVGSVFLANALPQDNSRILLKVILISVSIK